MSKENDLRYLRRAIDLAGEGMHKGVGGPFGAVIVRNDEIIAEGYNQVIAHHDPTAHAEVQVIRKACRKLGTYHLTGATIYTSCEPCPMCFGAIYWARLDRVVYAAGMQDADKIEFYDLFIYNELQKPGGERTVPFEQLLKDEGGAVFKAWADKEDKTTY